MAAEEDWRAQVDEAQALEAIFEENDFRVAALEAAGGDAPGGSGAAAPLDAAALAAAPPPPSGGWALRCELVVRPQVPAGGLRVRAPGAAGGVLVAHLAPIMLRLEMGAGYPSERAPAARLAALWLPRARAAELEAELAALWRDQGAGLPVAFAWAEWLRAEALPRLGAAEALVLEPGAGAAGSASGASFVDGDGDKDEDEAGGGFAGAADALLFALARYSAARADALFQRELHRCSVCLEPRAGSRFPRLDCGHAAACADCLGAQAALHAREGSLDALRCPAPGCAAPLPEHALRALLPPPLFARWEQLALQRALDTMSDCSYCPRCATPALEDADDHCASCSKCLFVFCALCLEGRHPGAACVSDATKVEMLRRKAAGGGAAAVAELRRREHELLSAAEVARSTVRCPSCGASVQRAEGCNKMVCLCGTAFCYRCGAGGISYDHFGAEGCHLFDADEIARWERRWGAGPQLGGGGGGGGGGAEDGDGDAGLQQALLDGAGGAAGSPEGAPARRRRRQRPWFLDFPRCPRCGCVHERRELNLIVCGMCSRHFCAACAAPLERRHRDHFGAGRCPMHGPPEARRV
jgi:hypothetical protein